MTTMFVIFGLGNPGEKYDGTRHNVGFFVVDEIARGEWQGDKYAQAQIAKQSVGETEAWFVKPQTFMNKSGETVAYLQKEHELTPQEVIVIHDDLDLPVGTFRISYDRGAGGNNGVQSVIDHLQTKAFTRIRIGIMPIEDRQEAGSKMQESGSTVKDQHSTFHIPHSRGRDFVLSGFLPEEQEQVEKLVPQIREAIDVIVEEGREKAMNTFN